MQRRLTGVVCLCLLQTKLTVDVCNNLIWLMLCCVSCYNQKQNILSQIATASITKNALKRRVIESCLRALCDRIPNKVFRVAHKFVDCCPTTKDRRRKHPDGCKRR